MKVCVITTSRADWNALEMVAKALKAEGAEVTILPIDHSIRRPDQISMPADYIAKDWRCWDVFDRDDGADTVAGALHICGAEMTVLLGDRHETAVAAVASLMAGLPIAHLAGGDVTEGSADDLFRSAITKMAHLHFPTNNDAARRIIKMGEAPSTVFMHGSASVDRVAETPIIPLSTLRPKLGITQQSPIIIVNWQVPTAEDDPNAGLKALFEGADSLGGSALDATQCALVFVGVNPENGSEEAEVLIEEFIRDRSYAYGFKSLPGNEYLSLMAQCEILIGNSSSAYYEAPYFGIPAVDIGDRQKGRERSVGIIGADPNAIDIAKAIGHARAMIGMSGKMPYGEPGAAVKIAKTILANPVKGIRKASQWAMVDE